MPAERSLIRVRLTSEELSELLNSIRNQSKLTYADILSFIDPAGDLNLSVGLLQNRMLNRAKFTNDEIECISATLHEKVSDTTWTSLKGHHGELLERIFQPSIDLPNALANWTGTGSNQSDFQKKRTGIGKASDGNGEFLILRLSRDRSGASFLICSYMLIVPPTPKSPMPQFLTHRPQHNGVRRSIRGVIFERNGLIYSIGKSRYMAGFRTTMLKAETRGADRHDMFGVRLGMHEDPDLPFAYPIYCYQMKSERSYAAKRQLLGKKAVDDEFMNRQLNGLDKIIERLRTSARYEFGCA